MKQLICTQGQEDWEEPVEKRYMPEIAKSVNEILNTNIKKSDISTDLPLLLHRHPHQFKLPAEDMTSDSRESPLLSYNITP